MFPAVNMAQGLGFAGTAVMTGMSLVLARPEGFSLNAERQAIIRRYAMAAGSVTVCAHLVMFMARSSEMLGKSLELLGAGDLVLIAGDTRFGQVWLLQGVLLSIATVMVFARLSPGVVFLLGTASLVVLPLDAHVMVTEGAFLPKLANVLHVVFAGLWFGGVVTLLALRRAVGSDGDRLLVSNLSRFSRFALPAMLLVLASGMVLATETVGRWAALLATDYGLLLLAKLTLVAMVLLAAARLRGDLRKARSGRPMVPSLAFEGGCALMVVILAGWIAQTTPGAHADITWWLPFRLVPDVSWKQPGVPLQVGCGIAACAIAALAWLWPRERRTGAITFAARTASAAGFAGGVAAIVQALSVSAYATTYTKPAVTYAAADIAAGRQLFMAHCTACHGETGHGDGPAAASLKPPPADLTAAHVGDHTAGDMYWWITHGMSGSSMPAFASVIDDAGRWQLIMYLMAMSHGYEARLLSSSIAPRNPWLPAINIPFESDDEVSSLMEARGKNSRMVVLINGDRVPEKQLSALRSQASGFLAQNAEIVLVVPESMTGVASEAAGTPGLRVVPDSGAIVEAWSHYRRSFVNPDFKDRDRFPEMVAYLVDRFGFVRARWRADEAGGLPGGDAVLSQIRMLAEEPEIRSADEHLH